MATQRLTLNQIILHHLCEFGLIDQKTAMDCYRIASLSTRISELRKIGCEIETFIDQDKALYYVEDDEHVAKVLTNYRYLLTSSQRGKSFFDKLKDFINFRVFKFISGVGY